MMKLSILIFAVLLVLTNGFVFPNGFQVNKQLSKRNMRHQMVTGKVKFFDSQKGYGFITPDDGSEDIFVHQTAIYAQGFRSLAEGEIVEFEVTRDADKGKTYASNVTGPNGGHVQGGPRPPRDDFNRY